MCPPLWQTTRRRSMGWPLRVPVILEAASPNSYQWYNRVSVYTGLPDVLGWPDHEEEERYATQLGTRLADIGTMYSSPDTVQTMSLLHLYHVRYVYVGALERSTYGPWNKFDHMAGLRVVYQSDGVTIYEVL